MFHLSLFIDHNKGLIVQFSGCLLDAILDICKNVQNGFFSEQIFYSLPILFSVKKTCSDIFQDN